MDICCIGLIGIIQFNWQCIGSVLAASNWWYVQVFTYCQLDTANNYSYGNIASSDSDLSCQIFPYLMVHRRCIFYIWLAINSCLNSKSFSLLKFENPSSGSKVMNWNIKGLKFNNVCCIFEDGNSKYHCKLEWFHFITWKIFLIKSIFTNYFYCKILIDICRYVQQYFQRWFIKISLIKIF